MNPTRNQLRTILRDQNRRIWSNDELDDMLDHGLSWWNLVSPETSIDLGELRKGALPNAGTQQSAVLWASVVLSIVLLLQPRGLKHDVVLDPEERTRYEELLTNAEEMFDRSKMTKSRIILDDQTVWN